VKVTFSRLSPGGWPKQWFGRHVVADGRRPCEGARRCQAFSFSTLGLRVIKKKRRAHLFPHGLEADVRVVQDVRSLSEIEFFIDNLLVRVHFIIVMITWTGLAPREFEFLFQVALHLPS